MVLVYKWTDCNQSLMQKSLSWASYLRTPSKDSSGEATWRVAWLQDRNAHYTDQLPTPWPKQTLLLLSSAGPPNHNQEKRKGQAAKSMKMLCPWQQLDGKPCPMGVGYCLSHNIKSLPLEREAGLACSERILLMGLSSAANSSWSPQSVSKVGYFEHQTGWASPCCPSAAPPYLILTVWLSSFACYTLSKPLTQNWKHMGLGI